MEDYTEIFSRARNGDASANRQLIELLYDELRRLARGRLHREFDPKKHDATSLVHEAYLRMTNNDASNEWSGREHFFAAASKTMRRFLIDEARRLKTTKHGREYNRVPMISALHGTDVTPEAIDEILDVGEAVNRLEQLGGHAAEYAAIVDMKYFAGMSNDDIAEIMQLSKATVKRRWNEARECLKQQLESYKNFDP